LASNDEVLASIILADDVINLRGKHPKSILMLLLDDNRAGEDVFVYELSDTRLGRGFFDFIKLVALARAREIRIQRRHVRQAES
jgi:hypothetical protein